MKSASVTSPLGGSLEERLADPGFTAGRATFAGVIDALGHEVWEKAAFRALERAGVAAVPAYAKWLEAPPEGTPGTVVARAAVLQLLGRIARKSVNAPGAAELNATALLEGELLRAPSPRTFREAVVQIGKGEATSAALVRAARIFFDAAPEARWGSIRPADHDAIVRELLWALAKVGGEEGRSLAKNHGISGRASVVAMREAARENERLPLAAETVLPKVEWRLHCRPGLAELLRREVEARLPGTHATVPSSLETGQAEASVVRFEGAFSVGDLGAIRLATRFEAIFPQSRQQALTGGTATERITYHLVTHVLPWLTTVFGVPPRVRIVREFTGRRRAETFALAEALAAHGVVSDGRDAGVTIRMESLSETDAISDVRRWAAVELSDLGASRFAYRVADVPAASHPTVAAALVYAASLLDGAPTGAEAAVWDPFCGSALELIEAAQAGNSRLFGTDRELRALVAARANVAAAKVPPEAIELVVDDACHYRPRLPITLIVTNPPLGRRVQDAEGITRLLTRFVAHAATVLAPGGRLVWLSPVPKETRNAALDAGLVPESVAFLLGPIDLGGISVELQIFRAVV